jgi:hypothetical protein
VNQEDLLPAFHSRSINGNMPVKTTGTHQGLVKNVWSVGTGKDDDLLLGIEAIHLS